MTINIVMATLIGTSLFLASPSYAQQQKQPRVTSAERQAAWPANKAEYQRRVARDGKASADRWLDQQVRAKRVHSGSQPRVRKNTKDCKKIRWVSRATPGFGGAPMTMRRVAVCAD